MGLEKLTSRGAVLEAMRKYDELGRDAFLARYGFGVSRRYVLRHEGRDYDSKAVAGVAYGIQFPHDPPCTPATINGGVGYAGAATVLRRMGFDVFDTHGRRGAAADRIPARIVSNATPRAALRPPTPSRSADLLLIGCVKQKRASAAPASELYTSDLFGKRRSYAERTGVPWFILSALHGLVSPETVIEPYDVALKDQTASYRREWGEKVVTDLIAGGSVAAGSVVEVHAGASYVDAIAPGLVALGAEISQPLTGLTFGEQLSWYLRSDAATVVSAAAPTHSAICRHLGDPANSAPCLDFPWGRNDLDVAGLYSWWVDESGASMLSRGLGQPIDPGLVYAGLAGATSAARITVSSTLRSRVAGNHLRGGIHGSTWRKSLTAILLDQLDLDMSSGDLSSAAQVELTNWMHDHLRLAVYPIVDSHSVGAAEDALLMALDPPLNLDGMAETAVRASLRDLRRALPRKRRG
jgi:hypothetical protein